mmetsp:Transcript_21557/g.71412  ORF Transcript_21557/g.71412 Transcript_21557/m.71412 type:complete len:87 (-) Transcript_21557:158-418(-)
MKERHEGSDVMAATLLPMLVKFVIIEACFDKNVQLDIVVSMLHAPAMYKRKKLRPPIRMFESKKGNLFAKEKKTLTRKSPAFALNL